MDRPNSCFFFFPSGCCQISQISAFCSFCWRLSNQFVCLYPWRGHLQSDQHFSSQICMTVPMAMSFAKRPAFSVTNLYDCAHGEVMLKTTSIFGHQFVWLYPWRGHLQSDQHFSSQICMTVPTARSFATRPAFSVTNLYDCTHGEKFLIARYSSPFWFFFWFLHPLICTILTDLQKHPFLSTKSVGLCKNPNFHRWEQVSA